MSTHETPDHRPDFWEPNRQPSTLDAAREEDLEILRTARQKPPKWKSQDEQWAGRRVTAQEAWFGLLLLLVILFAVLLFTPGAAK